MGQCSCVRNCPFILEKVTACYILRIYGRADQLKQVVYFADDDDQSAVKRANTLMIDRTNLAAIERGGVRIFRKERGLDCSFEPVKCGS